MIADQGFELHPGAASDITSIWEFIAKDNPLAAKRVREDILDAIRRLVPFPHQGHQRTDLTSRPLRFRKRHPEAVWTRQEQVEMMSLMDTNVGVHEGRSGHFEASTEAAPLDDRGQGKDRPRDVGGGGIGGTNSATIRSECKSD